MKSRGFHPLTPQAEVVCKTPLGEELSAASWLDEPTRIMSQEELGDLLLRVERIQEQDRLRQFLHTKPTIKMPAVKWERGGMADAADSKSVLERGEGSSPSVPTK